MAELIFGDANNNGIPDIIEKKPNPDDGSYRQGDFNVFLR